MWKAIANVATLCSPSGVMFIAIYNYLGSASKVWVQIKRAYCKAPQWLKGPFALAVIVPVQLYSFLIYMVQGKTMAFFRENYNYRTMRGMNWWHDQVDWIGGYPYEDAKPEEIFQFLYTRRFSLKNLTTCRGNIGCNQFVVQRESAAS